MILSAYLGVSGVGDIGYRFYNVDESTNGPRITAGVVDAGNGWYSADATIPAGAVSVRWDSTGNAELIAREYFFHLIQSGTGIGMLDITSGIAQAKISEGTGTGQLSLDAGKVKISPGTGLGQVDLSSGNVKVASGGIISTSFASGAITKAALSSDTGLVPARTGTCQGGGSNYITLDAGASSVNNFYRNGVVILTAGTGAGTFGIIESYDGVTKNAVISTPFVVTPVGGDTQFAILPLGAVPTSAPTADEIAEAVTSRVLAAASFNPDNDNGGVEGRQIVDHAAGGLDITGVVGNTLNIDVYFPNSDLTGYTFEGYVILEPAPLEKRFPLTIIPTDLANGQIAIYLTDTQTTDIGPVSGKPWFLKWDGGATAIKRSLLMGKFQLNRF